MINMRRSAVSLMAVTGVGYGLSFGKEMVVAWRFGLTKGMDAYYAALTLPGAVSNLIGFAATAVVVPAYIRMKSRDPRLAAGLGRRMTLDIPLALAAAAAVVALFSRPLTRLLFPGLSPEASELAASLQRWTAAGGAFLGLAALLSGLHNAEGRLVLPALSGSMVTLATVAAILLLAKSWGVTALAVGLLVGAGLQVALLGIGLLRVSEHADAPRLGWTDPAMKELAPLLAVLLATYGMAETYTLIDRVMASTLPEGSIAALGCALKLVAVPQAVLCAPIITAAYPVLAERDARGEHEALAGDFRKATRLGYATLLPAAGFLILFARPVIQVLFQRGRFDEAATRLAAATFAGFCLQLPWTVPAFLVARIVMIRQAGRTLFAVTAAGAAMNIVFNWVMMRLWNPPVAGIAVSTSMGSLFMLTLYCAALRRDAPWMSLTRVLAEARPYLLPTAAMLACAELAWRLSAMAGVGPVLLRLGLAAALGGAGLALTAHRLRVDEMVRGLDLVRARLGAAS